MLKPSFFALLGVFALQHGIAQQKADDGKINITLLQVNDVYEIEPLEGGKIGGMAKVATAKRIQQKANPNTMLIHAGDFVSPSVIGTLEYEGRKIAGKHMVDAMNVAGIDLATFGNHEFDIKEADIVDRITESKFDWISSNVRHIVGKDTLPFQHKGADIPKIYIKSFTDADGTTAKIGFFAVTLPANKQAFVQYDNETAAALRAYEYLKDKVDVVIGITHINIADDKILAAKMQGVPLFIGGHDHNNMYIKVGKTSIAKADANAKTMYQHDLTINTQKHSTKISSKLLHLDTSVALDSATDAVVKKWGEIANSSFSKIGFKPTDVVATLKKPMDARETVLRNVPTPLGEMCANALLEASPGADCAIFNTGSVRIDDIVQGTLTQFDIIRILPFGGEISVMDMKGSLLLQALQNGLVKCVGSGTYLAVANLTFDAKTNAATVKGASIDPAKTYRVAMPTYLAIGKGQNLEFLIATNPDVSKVEGPASPSDLRADVRKAVIAHLQKHPY